MRHRVDHRKLGRTRSHRKAMLANMVTSLFEREKIQTTDAKAKEARRQAERLITRAKKGYSAYKEHEALKAAGKEVEAKQMQAVALAHWRVASRVVRKRAVLKKLFDEIAPQYLEREGGYTRVLRLGVRHGDNANTVLLELVESDKTSGRAKRKGKKGAEAKPGKGEAKPKRKKAARPKKDAEETKAKAKADKQKKAAAKEEEVKAEAADAPEDEAAEATGGTEEEPKGDK